MKSLFQRLLKKPDGVRGSSASNSGVGASICTWRVAAKLGGGERSVAHVTVLSDIGRMCKDSQAVGCKKDCAAGEYENKRDRVRHLHVLRLSKRPRRLAFCIWRVAASLVGDKRSVAHSTSILDTCLASKGSQAF